MVQRRGSVMRKAASGYRHPCLPVPGHSYRGIHSRRKTQFRKKPKESSSSLPWQNLRVGGLASSPRRWCNFGAVDGAEASREEDARAEEHKPRRDVLLMSVLVPPLKVHPWLEFNAAADRERGQQCLPGVFAVRICVGRHGRSLCSSPRVHHMPQWSSARRVVQTSCLSTRFPSALYRPMAPAERWLQVSTVQQPPKPTGCDKDPIV